MSGLRQLEAALLGLSLDGYPLGPKWLGHMGWKIAYDTAVTALHLMAVGVAIAALYCLGAWAVMWIARAVG